MICLPLDEEYAARTIGVQDLKDGLISNYASVVGWGYTEYDPLVRQKQGDFLRAGVANQVQQQLSIPLSADGGRFLKDGYDGVLRGTG